MKRFAKPALAIGTSLLCLLVAEFALRRIAPVQDPYAELKVPRPEVNQYIKSEHPKNLRVVVDPEAGLPGMKGPNVFTTNNMGFRGDDLTIPKPANEFRVFMVGGSTTECVYLDDSNAITRVLQNELNKQPPNNLTVKVYNAGKSGDATDDHVSMIVHRIVQLQPDLIIVFAGINDLTRSINDYDYLHYVQPVPLDRFRYLKYSLTESQIARRIYYLFNRNPQNFSQLFQEIHLTSNYQEKVRVCNSLPLSNARPRVNVGAFAYNLRTIAGVASAQGIKLVLMTQQTTWSGPENANLKEWQWILCRSGAKYREDYLNEALTALNDQTRQVAREFSIPVYDLAGTMPKSRDFFYDDVHFNDRGAHEAAVGLAAVIGGMNVGPGQSPGK
jgi:lysophospholipase L1-like esterase